jgi:hypothetical protein
MESLSACIYLETLNHHTNQAVYEAAQELTELYDYHRTEVHGCDFEIEDRPYNPQQE